MTDIASAGSPESPDFSDAERWEVVMVDISLAVFRTNRIEPLLLCRRAERHRGDDLGLAAGEDGRAMGARKVASFDPDWSNLIGAPAIGPRAVLQNAAPNLFLQNRFEGVHD